jgi:hypothetical protein
MKKILTEAASVGDVTTRAIMYYPFEFGPEVEDVMQVDVGKQRRRHRSLPGSPVTDRHRPVFRDARLKPFLDQADDALVADPMFHETDQPFLANRVETRPVSRNQSRWSATIENAVASTPRKPGLL